LVSNFKTTTTIEDTQLSYWLQGKDAMAIEKNKIKFMKIKK
jgi:hypothetical protein